MPNGSAALIIDDVIMDASIEGGNRTVVSWGLEIAGMFVTVSYQDKLAVLTEKVRLLGNEWVDILLMHDKTDVESYTCRLLAHTIRRLGGDNNLLELYFQSKSGYLLTANYPSTGYEDTTIGTILQNEVESVGLDFETVPANLSLSTTASVPAMNCRLGAWLNFVLEMGYGDKFIRIHPDEKIQVLDFGNLLSQKPLATLGFKEGEVPIYSYSKSVIAGRMMLGDTISGVYLDLPDAVEATEEISFSELSNKELVESVPSYNVTKPIFLGIGINGNVPKHDIVASFIARNEKIAKTSVSTIGTTAWEPGSIVELDIPGTLASHDWEYFGKWMILTVDHVFGDGEWVSNLELIRAGQIMKEHKWQNQIDVKSEAGGVVQ